LTKDELDDLGALVKVLEGRAGGGPNVGVFPGAIVTAAVGAAARWLVELVVEYLRQREMVHGFLQRVLGGVAHGRELTDEEIREADRLLGELDAPSVEDLLRVRRALEAKRK
jgi:hypothetical protein